MPEMIGGLFGSTQHATWMEALIALPAAFVVGQLLSWVYEATYHGLSYSRKFADTLTLLTCVSACFVLISRQSLLAGLGLMAVMSMVRFRANVKAPSDLVFIMASATFGLGCGLLAIELSIVGFLAFALFSLFLSADSLGSRRRFDGVLRLRTATASDDPAALDAILDRHCVRSVLLASSEVAQGGVIEHSYQVKFRRPEARDALLGDLRHASSIRDVRLLMQEVNLEY